MPATFEVAAAVFEQLPNLRIAVAVARGLDNRQVRPALAAEWHAAWQSAAAAAAPYGNAQSHPRVKPWRDAFQRMGISGKQFPSSVEALLRRALKGGEPFTINPLVDCYNAVSLRQVVPAGAFDLVSIQDHLELRLSRAGDTFIALDESGASEPLAVPPGELSYASGARILTRHLVWRQSRLGLVTPETRDVILVSEVLRELGPDVPTAVCDEFERGLRQHFGVAARRWIIDADQPVARW
jgi:DNA/RNA-binding domain of Phe-tRNA-synthetase-like protein